MKLHRHILFQCLAASLLLLPLHHCGSGTEIGNPERVALRISGYDSSTSKLSPFALSSGISISEARIVLSEIRFRPLSACQSGDGSSTADVDFSGPYVADLLSNTTTPDTGATDIPAGSYCRVELKLDKLEDDEIPSGISSSDPLVDHSVRIEGTRGDGVPFVATLAFDDEFRLENQSSGFAVGIGGTVSDFFIAFDLEEWFSGVDLSGADETSGTIIIDEDNNKTLHEALITNIKLSAHLFEDSDADGDLESSERESSDVLGEGEDI